MGLAHSLVGITDLTFSEVASGLKTVFDGARDTTRHLRWVNSHWGVANIFKF